MWQVDVFTLKRRKRRKSLPVADNVQAVTGAEEGVPALHLYEDTVSLLP